MRWYLTVCVAAAALLSPAAGSSSSAGPMEYLLPASVRPYHYDIFLAFDINRENNFPFYGVVDIQLKAQIPTNKIVLHAQGYKIQDDKIALKGENAPDIAKVELVTEDLNFLTLYLSDQLVLGINYTLSIPFSGNNKFELDGVYISSYDDKETKKTEYLVTTQFESISARKGFPCFDEPMYKATFSINLGHSEDFTAVSNMPVARTVKTNLIEEYWPWRTISEKFTYNESSYIWHKFQKSVPMSTYLVAFVISKFSHMVSPEGLSKTKFSIWARNDAVDQTSYAATTGPKVLTFYEGWFNVSFPLPKQDMFAIPDFSAGAMENWGLITYRETALLYHKDESSFQNKERVFEVIAHELAHQWFGNLVTMKWWSDLWLNEGFATYMASIAMQALEPEWLGEKTEAVTSMLSVLNLDSLESSHPVSVPIDNPKRIGEIFDEISYKKGSLLIRMMYMFLGDSVFRKAINNYLFKYSYSNAEQDDLWRELTLVGQHYAVLSPNVSVKTIMDTWTKQTGYPLITVKRDYDDGSLTVLQKRYLALGAKAETTVSWWVPLNVLCQNEVGRSVSDPVQWLSDQEGTKYEQKYEHGSKSDEWVLFNNHMFAPYRVNYDARNWQLLIRTLNTDDYQNIPILSRVQLLADSFALVWSNDLDYNITLDLVKYLHREEDYLPMHTGTAALYKIDNVLKRSPEYGAFQKFVRGLITPAYERSGGLYAKKIVNDHDPINVKMQVLASRMACYMKVPGCEDNAMELFRSWMETSNPDEENPIPLDLRRTVYCVAASRGSVAEWRFLLERKQKANVASARNSLLAGMACTREVWILKQFLEWTIEDGSEVRRQDSGMVISSIMNSQVGYYIAKEFVLTRIDDIYKAFGGQSRRVGNIVKTMVEQFTTEQELDDFLEWKKHNSKYLTDSVLAVEQGVEKARVNIGWIKKNKNDLIKKIRDIRNKQRRNEAHSTSKSQDSIRIAFILTALLRMIL